MPAHWHHSIGSRLSSKGSKARAAAQSCGTAFLLEAKRNMSAGLGLQLKVSHHIHHPFDQTLSSGIFPWGLSSWQGWQSLATADGYYLWEEEGEIHWPGSYMFSSRVEGKPFLSKHPVVRLYWKLHTTAYRDSWSYWSQENKGAQGSGGEGSISQVQ